MSLINYSCTSNRFHPILSPDSTDAYPQHTQSLDGTLASSIPLYRSSEEEKRVTVIKAPHYPGIGPVDESGIPTAIRTVGNARCLCLTPGLCQALQRMDCGWLCAFLWSYLMRNAFCTIRVLMNIMLCVAKKGNPTLKCFSI